MHKTELLYYHDPYLRRFRGRVVARQTVDGKPAVALDRTAFYPTGGGQPNDTGLLAGAAVIDVFASDGLVWHVLSREIPDDDGDGEIAWTRRFDHMQQHSGQHILSQAFVRTCGAETVAFHMGPTASTIDLDQVGLGTDTLRAAEAAANAVVDGALPITAVFVGREQLSGVPLRKPPKVTEDVRVVQVEGFDWSACGGTHLASAAEVGLIKIVGAERRGAELRVSFLCGARARADYGRLQLIVEGLASSFSVGQDDVPAAVERLTSEQRAIRRELADLEGQWVESAAAALWAASEECAPWRIVSVIAGYPLERAKRVAQLLRARSGAVVLLGIAAERPQVIFTRADDVSLDAGALLREAVAVGGGRGGGRPDWAQGGVPTTEALNLALNAAQAIIRRTACGKM